MIKFSGKKIIIYTTHMAHVIIDFIISIPEKSTVLAKVLKAWLLAISSFTENSGAKRN
jgi:hypothetical protein